MSKIVVLTTDTPMRDLTLPLAKDRLEMLTTLGLFVARMSSEEETKVCSWCLGINVAYMPCEVPEESLRAAAKDSEHTPLNQDMALAEWVLRAWAIVELIRDRA